MLERAPARLVDDLFATERVELRNDVVAYFSANEETAQGSFVADSKA